MDKSLKSEHSRDRMAIYRAAVGSLTDLLIVTDRRGTVLWTESMNGRIPELLTREQWYERISPDDLPGVRRTFARIATFGITEGCTFRLRRTSGEWGWMEAVGIPMTQLGEDETVLVAIRDITKQKNEENALRRMAFHDSLTGLPNRRLFEEHLAQAIAHTRRNEQIMAVFFLDVDDFKQINDGFGHEIGDLFLIAFAKRVKACVREIDTFARMGGDEFTILLPIVDSAEGVEKVACRIMDAVKKGWDIAGMRLHSTVSIGIAIYPSDGSDAQTLLRNVDRALYEAKSSGRNGYRFYRR